MAQPRPEARLVPATYPHDGGRMCSLEYRPRRWFGCRLEKIVGDFFQTDDATAAGLRVAVLDLLRGAVRHEFDERVLVNAHHAPDLGSAQVTVTVFFRLPSDQPTEINEVLGLLGRLSTRTSHFRFGTTATRATAATLAVQSKVLHEQEGESMLVTALTVCAQLRG